MITDFGLSNDVARAIRLQSDGKILLAGSSVINGNKDFSVARYNSNGTLDTTFNTTGKATISVGSGDDNGYSMLVESTGKIIIAGSSMINGNLDFALIRLTSAGLIDTTFGSNGKTTTSFGTANDEVLTVFNRANKVYVGGYTFNGTNKDAAIACYIDGILDASFGNGGKTITNAGPGDDVINGIGYYQDDSVIVIGGTSSNGENNDFLNATYTLNGNLVTAGYGYHGIARIDMPNYACIPKTIIKQNDNKVIMAGTTYANFISGPGDFAITRLNVDGSPDMSFGNDGRVVTHITGNDDMVNALALQPDGKIVAGGMGDSNGSTAKATIARYNTDGSLDTSFGTNGISINTEANTSILAIAVQPDGKIVTFGEYLQGSSTRARVSRFNPDGSYDTAFGSNGNGKENISYYTAGFKGVNVIIQPDGKIVVGGGATSGSFIISRFLPNGTPDTAFGGGGTGYVSTAITQAILKSIVLQPDGKILAAGSSLSSSSPFCLIARYNTDGNLDTSFGNGGIYSHLLPGSTNVSASSGYITLQTDGKILFAASGLSGSTWLFRCNANGTTDASFNESYVFLYGETNHPVGLFMQNNKLILGASAGPFFAASRFDVGLPLANEDFVEGGHKVLVYPNPITSDGIVHIVITDADITGVTIYDLSGKNLGDLSGNIFRSGNSNTVQLPVNLSKGIYILNIETSKGKTTTKIVKR